ncbi:LysR family transcriptional regulator [Yersinia frederiksenii]|nr:LysR family transcriptional regulator [Yersinia frederiksenii]
MLEAMRIFVQVAEQESFSRAADILQLHRPAVSKTMQQLEREVGVKLLHRTTRKVSMTAEGEEFYQCCIRLINDFSDTMAAFSPTLPPRGRLRLDMPITLATAIIIPALPDFKDKYPDIEIVLRSSDRRVDLIAEGVDCVVRLGELNDSSFIGRRVGEAKMVTCASPEYLRKYGTPLTLDDLANHKAVNFFSNTSQEVMDWKFLNKEEVVTRRIKSSILVDNSEAFISCGLAGIGILQGLRVSLDPYIQAGKLVEIFPHIPSVAKPISVLYPDRRYLSPKVRAFVDWVSELFSIPPKR